MTSQESSEPTLWLVRHAESAANVGLPTQSPQDVPLTDHGVAQAAAFADGLERCPDCVIVSPFARAIQTAAPIRERWPEVPWHILPIHEFTYLAPHRCQGTTVVQRRPWVEDYWRLCDPYYIDGERAESFVQFVDRIRAFHEHVVALSGFTIAVGHGQFFRAYLFGLGHRFETVEEWMRSFRHIGLTRSMRNCEIMSAPLHQGGVSVELPPCITGSADDSQVLGH